MGSREDADRRKRIKHNAEQIAKYAECRERFQKGTAPSFFNLQSDTEFESSVTYSAYLERFYADEDNAHAASLINHVLRRLEALGSLTEPFVRVESHSGILKRWRDTQSENDRYWLNRFNALCLAIAELIEKENPGQRLIVKRNPGEPEEEPANSKVHARNLDNNRKKSWDAQDYYRKLDAEIERIIDEESCTLEAAIGLYRDRLERREEKDVSRATIMRARAFVRAEEAGVFRGGSTSGISEEEWMARRASEFESGGAA